MFYINIDGASALREQFLAADRDYYSYLGYEALINLFDDGENVELGVVAICCDFRETDFKTIARENRINLSECEDEAEEMAAVEEYLNENTWARSTMPSNFIYQEF